MEKSGWILLGLIIEAGLFIFEISRSVISTKNKRLLKANTIDKIEFINLEKGYWTKISWFRISLCISYFILVVIYIDFSRTNWEELFAYLAIGILLYILIMRNIKLFIFRATKVLIIAPFDPWFKSITFYYGKIRNFRVFRALYNAHVLVLDIENEGPVKIEFSGTSIPRNDLIIRVILNTVTGLKKDFVNKKFN